VNLSRLHRNALLTSDYQNLPIRKSHDRDIRFVNIYIFTEPGERPDMDAILFRFLGATILETLPYVKGYCGEFREGITQQAGPRQIPGLFIDIFFINFYLF
jgi:hypothetical protein